MSAVAGAAGLGRQQRGRAPGLLEEKRGLLHLGLGHDPAVHDADPVLLGRELRGGRDPPGNGRPILSHAGLLLLRQRRRCRRGSGGGHR